MIKRIVQFTLLVLVASALGCTFHLQPVVPKETFISPVERIPVSILLMVADDFWEYEYVASYEGREIRYFLGRSARDYLPSLLATMFSSASMIENVGDNLKYDWIATPKWGQQNSYVKPFVFGFETSLQIEFVSRDSKKSFSVSSKGKGEAHAYVQSSLQGAGNDAMKELMINLQEKILSKKESFKVGKQQP